MKISELQNFFNVEHKIKNFVLILLLILTFVIWITSTIAWGRSNEILKISPEDKDVIATRNSSICIFIISSIIAVYLSYLLYFKIK